MMWMISMILISKSPYFLIVSLLFTTFYCMYSMTMLLSTMWFSLLILIILIGGLLVLFLYLISLIPKENMNLALKFPILLMIVYGMILLSNNTNELKIFNPQMMYYYPIIITFFIMFLLMTLFVSTQLTNLKSGPLRLL